MAPRFCGKAAAGAGWRIQPLILTTQLLALVATAAETGALVRRNTTQGQITILDNLKLQRYGFVGHSYGFLMKLSIGIPPQDVTVKLTGDDLTWVPLQLDEETRCKPNDREGCQIVDTYGIYNPFLADASEMVVVDGPPQSGLPDDIQGVPAYGKISLDGIQVQDFTFIAARTFAGTPQLGIAVRSSEVISPSRGSEVARLGLLAAIQRQQLIDVVGIGIYYDAYDINLSQITLGAVDTEKYELPMVTYTWPTRGEVGGLVTQRVTLSTGNAASVSLTNQRTFITLGESDIRVPESLRNSILEALDTHRDTNGTYFVNCDAAEKLDFSLDFEFDGINITLTAKDLIGRVQEANQTECRVFLDSSESSGTVANIDGVSATLYLGIPFLRVAYVWLDYQNNQTSLAKAKQRITTSKYVKIKEDGIVATLGEQKATPPETEPPPETEVPPPPNESNRTEPDKPPVGAIAGGTVGGVIALALIGGLIFWRMKRDPDVPGLPPPPMGELDGDQRHELAAAHGKSEVLGSEEYSKELPASNQFPAELPGQPMPRESGERVVDSDSRDS
ncbi:hypothetical protein TWF281_000107 [Arthrobotrys megalospora]